MVDDRKTSSTYSYCLKLEKLRLILYNKNEEVIDTFAYLVTVHNQSLSGHMDYVPE